MFGPSVSKSVAHARRRAVGFRKSFCTAGAAEPLTIKGVQFHPKFVRENLRDEKTWDESSMQRLAFNIPPTVKGQVDENQTDATSVQVSFDDGSVGPFVLPPDAKGQKDVELKRLPRSWWTPKLAESVRARALNMSEFGPLQKDRQLDLAVADHSAVEVWSPDEKAQMRQWLRGLHEDGIALVTGMPAQPKELVNFADRLFGYTLPTMYGKTFTIKAVERPNNLAYSNLGLQLHTDLPYCDVAPPIQLFHCIQQARVGGGNIFADGFHAAERLRESHPDLFKVLIERKIGHMDRTPLWEYYAEHPAIQVDSEGAVERVHFNERTRDSMRQWKQSDNVADMDVFYRALFQLEQYIDDTATHFHITLQPGEMTVIDNWRVLHSRESFEGARWLEGGYITWEQCRSMWRTCQ